MSTPTPQGISALLRKAGFKRADKPVRGGICSGYRVGVDYRRAGAVNVRHLFWSMRATPEQHRAELDRYAQTITEAGWTVEVGTYELIVTAKPASLLAAKDGDPR